MPAYSTPQETPGGTSARDLSSPMAKARLVAGTTILGTIYFLAGSFGLSLAVINASASAVWPPTGIALAALVLFGRRLWPGIFIGAFLVNITTQGSWLTSLAIATGNTLEALSGAWLVARFAGGPRAFERIHTVLKFLVLAVFLSTAISATIGVTSLCLEGLEGWKLFLPVWLTWWLGDAVSNLVIAPFLIIWFAKSAFYLKPKKIAEAVVLLLTIFGVSQLVFPTAIAPLHANNPVGYLMLLPVMWAAFRFGRQGAITAAFLSCVLALWGTLHGFGPFIRPDPNESVIFVQAFVGTISGMALVLAAVISEREQARQGYARLAAVVESSEDAILTKSLAGIIMSWNGGAERLFGFRAQEIIGQSILRLIPPELHQEERHILERLQRGEALEHYETVRITREGGRLEVSLSLSAIRDEVGRIIGVSKILRDITARKKAEAALEQALGTLEETVQQRTASLTEALGELEAFSYSLSHDMRAPLRAIQSFTDIVLSDYSTAIPSEARQHLEKVMRAARRLDQLVLDVLALTRASRQNLALEPVDLEPLIQSLIQERPDFQPPQAEVQVEPPLYSVLGHESFVNQCLTNLLGNAVKFVASGVKPRIRIWAELSPPSSVRLWIEDNGIGINKATQSRLFQMFERVHSGREYEGSGIGLAIVRKAVERMGGAVGLESEPGKGSRFWLQLPLADKPTEKSKYQQEISKHQNPSSRETPNSNIQT
jgi:PAS domain S-box-containing protein